MSLSIAALPETFAAIGFFATSGGAVPRGLAASDCWSRIAGERLTCPERQDGVALFRPADAGIRARSLFGKRAA
ncbi:hypothetical protein [Tabrizicola soli]|uniref:Uncharacterized protein n=1 Tax=Tabrizicola soli TaxID=2185115 RepID=A0ABV7DSS9_9RHOB|nr:hypothetical protein [Tabrizicola soli]